MMRFPLKYLLGNKDPMMGKDGLDFDLMDFVCIASLACLVWVMVVAV